MEKIAVFVDDAGYAQQLLVPMLAHANGTGAPQWLVVGCAPRLTHRIGKWVSNSSRQQWRERWARSLRDELEPTFAGAGARVGEWLLARGPLEEFCRKLERRVGTLRLLDARRPKLGVDLQPLTADTPAPQARWAKPVAVSSGLSLVLALTD